MTTSQLFVYLLRFFIPGVWSVLFRAAAFGYTTKKRVALGVVVYTAYVLLVPAFLMQTIGYGEYTHIASFVMVVGSMAVFIFTTDSIVKTIFLQMVQGAMLTVMSVIFSMARTVFSFSYSTLLIIFAISSPILFFIGLKFWAKPMRYLADHLPDKMGSMLIMPVFSMLIVWFIPIYPQQNFANHPVFCTLIMIGTELALFAYVYTLYLNIKRIEVLKEEENKNKLLQTEIFSYQEYLEDARQNRHDLRHHDALLLSYLEDGKLTDAMDYLRSHDKAIANSTLTRYCEEPTINALLRIFERRAKELHIIFSATATIPNDLPFAPSELGGLLGNALENALHSTQNKSGSYISFSASLEDNNLLIEIRNSVVSEVIFQNGMPISQKTGGGTGTKSMVATTKKYGGIVRFTKEKNEFITRIILPL